MKSMKIFVTFACILAIRSVWSTKTAPTGDELISAIANDDINKAKKLIKDGVDVNYSSGNPYGYLTPLHAAISNDDTLEILKLLLQHDANLTVGGHYSPLEVAKRNAKKVRSSKNVIGSIELQFWVDIDNLLIEVNGFDVSDNDAKVKTLLELHANLPQEKNNFITLILRVASQDNSTALFDFWKIDFWKKLAEQKGSITDPLFALDFDKDTPAYKKYMKFLQQFKGWMQAQGQKTGYKSK